MTEKSPRSPRRSKRAAGQVARVPSLPDEFCYEVQPASIKEVCLALRDAADLKFETLIDLAGIDYIDYGRRSGRRIPRRAPASRAA